jgi:hypothetical protein
VSTLYISVLLNSVKIHLIVFVLFLSRYVISADIRKRTSVASINFSPIIFCYFPYLYSYEKKILSLSHTILSLLQNFHFKVFFVVLFSFVDIALHTYIVV